MKKIIGTLITVFLISPFMLQADYNFDEEMWIPLPQFFEKWKIGYQNTRENGSSVKRYILESETIHTWTQLVNIQFKDRKLVRCVDAAEAMKQEATLNQWVMYKIHTQSANDIIYEKIFPTGEHEVVRMLMTKKGLHRVAYAKRDAPFTDSERSQWIKRLSEGTLEINE